MTRESVGEYSAIYRFICVNIMDNEKGGESVNGLQYGLPGRGGTGPKQASAHPSH